MWFVLSLLSDHNFFLKKWQNQKLKGNKHSITEHSNLQAKSVLSGANSDPTFLSPLYSTQLSEFFLMATPTPQTQKTCKVTFWQYCCFKAVCNAKAHFGKIKKKKRLYSAFDPWL